MLIRKYQGQFYAHTFNNVDKVGQFLESYKILRLTKKVDNMGASLVAQWLRIRVPMQGTWARALVQEDPTYCGAAKPMSHNY